MSNRPTHDWKHAAKCAECLKTNPDIGKQPEEDKEYQKKVAKFNEARRKGQNPNVKDIITYVH